MKKKENRTWIGMLLFFLLLVIIIASSCNPCKFVTKYGKKHGCITETTHIKDSLVLKDTVIYRDTVVYVDLPPDTIYKEIYLEIKDGTIKPMKKHYKSAFIDLFIEVNDMVLTVDARLNKKQFKIVIRDAIVSVFKRYELYHTKNTTTVVREPYFPWWGKVLSVIGGIAIIALLLILLGKIERG